MTRLFLRVYFTDDSWLGPGKIALLEAIRVHRSISAAARAIGMSYRRAWLLTASLNRMFVNRAVDTTLGGPRGGTAVLIPFGVTIVKRYRAMERAARHAIAREVSPLAKRVANRPNAPPTRRHARRRSNR